MLRAMAVCTILAIALVAPEIASEDDEDDVMVDDDEGSSGSSEDQGATTVDLTTGEQHTAEDKEMFIVEGGGKRCLGCGTVDQEYSVDTNTTVCVTCYQQYANSLDAGTLSAPVGSTGLAHTTTVLTTGPGDRTRGFRVGATVRTGHGR